MPDAVTPKPAHRSLTLASTLAMALAFAVERAGLTPAPGALDAIAQALIDLVFSLGLLGVGVGRARASQPLM